MNRYHVASFVLLSMPLGCGVAEESQEENDLTAQQCTLFAVTATDVGGAFDLTLTEQKKSKPVVFNVRVPSTGDPELDNANWNKQNRIDYFYARFLTSAALHEPAAAGPMEMSICVASRKTKPRIVSPEQNSDTLVDLTVYLKNSTSSPLQLGEVTHAADTDNYFRIKADLDGVVVQSDDVGKSALSRRVPYIIRDRFFEGFNDSSTCGADRALNEGHIPRTELECKFHEVSLVRAPFGVSGELLRPEMFGSMDIIAAPDRTISWQYAHWDGKQETLAAHLEQVRSVIEANPGCRFEQTAPKYRAVCETNFSVQLAELEQLVTFFPGGDGPDTLFFPKKANGEVVRILTEDGRPAEEVAAQVIVPATDPVNWGSKTPFLASAGRVWQLPAGQYTVVVKSIWPADAMVSEHITLDTKAGRNPLTPPKK